MKNPLVAEKRLDKTGKLVTRHVRSGDANASDASKVPPPSLNKASASAKKYKPTPKQLEPMVFNHIVQHFKVSKLLRDYPEYDSRGGGNYSYYGFQANDVEAYSVFAATGSSGNAMEVMSRGFRSYESAVEYLEENGTESLIKDYRELADEALRLRVPAYDFLERYEMLDPKQRESENVLNLLRFQCSSLHSGLNGMTEGHFLDGTISFDDVKAVGTSKLLSMDKMYHLQSAFIKVNKGDADYTTQDIKEFIDKAKPLDRREFETAAAVFSKKGPELTNRFNDLKHLSAENYYLRKTEYPMEERVDRMVYAALLRDGTSGQRAFYMGYSDDYYDEGIPVELAIEALNSGGGLNESRGLHEGSAASLAGGWL